MKYDFQFLVGLLTLHILTSCNEEPHLASKSDESSMKEKHGEITQPQNVTPRSDRDKQLVKFAELRKFFNSSTSGVGSEELKELRSNLIAVAKTKDVSPMELAASMIMEVDSFDQQVKRMSRVVTAFEDTNEQLELAKYLPASRIRSLAVSGLSSQLQMKNDIQGLTEFYEILPVGKDRTNVSKTLTQLKVSKDGLLYGLDLVMQLEMPEERYSSMVGIESEWGPRIGESEVKSRIDEITKTLEGDAKEYLSLMISSRIRKTK